MGMFDTVYVAPEVAECLGLKCKVCGILFDDAQTKNLGSMMDDYCLVFDNKQIKLRKLDEPNDKQFWVEYTDHEIDERNKSHFGLKRDYKRGDGHYTDDAYFPKNRKQRDMGELPHGFVSIHAGHNCIEGELDRTWCELKLKFTDGVMVSFEVIE